MPKGSMMKTVDATTTLKNAAGFPYISMAGLVITLLGACAVMPPERLGITAA
jgi:hypothetical protein